MPKYEYAQYRRGDGSITRIYPNQLHDTATRATARTSELWDENFEVRVFPRYRSDTPHFFSLSPRRYLDKRSEQDPAHDDRVSQLLEMLKKRDYKIGCYDFYGDERQFVTISKAQRYLWGSEVTRILSSSVMCRHDIFGEQDSRNLTSGFPWIAIEVVRSHYPDEKTLQAFISLSAQLPFAVLFDVVAAPGYFLHVDEGSGEIRVIYYIYDGSVWKNGKRWKKCTAQFLREKIEQDVKKL